MTPSPVPKDEKHYYNVLCVIYDKFQNVKDEILLTGIGTNYFKPSCFTFNIF